MTALAPATVYVRAMNLSDAIDLYIGHLAREGRQPTTLASYRRLLNDLAYLVPTKCVHELELADYERFLNRWIGSSPSTMASGVSLVRGFSFFLYDRGLVPTDVGHKLKRPRKKRPEDLDVVTVSPEDVLRMLACCQSMQELLCLATPLYLSRRRAALSRVRRRDVDLVHGTVRFVDKGGKVHHQPIPDEYRELLLAAERDGVWQSGGDYLIPNRRPGAVRRTKAGKERSDKVIWETVKIVAARAGVNSHVHALRAAFAVAFDESHPDQVIALKELMGHSRLETTLVYLRRKDRAKAMEQVRDLSWGLPSGSSRELEKPPVSSGEAHTGFEPVFASSALPVPIRAKLDELRARRSDG